ncbi:hypothetical protein K9N68_36205 (plasmid) [Kovacikia minuta CCNUW1]|uniref:hypothetical protein n=1 Tax=Kovacikia minuta TaxID=2931930 RepID=UPI001CCA5657|nr:hypothetical protein [Kovacikia minuta]UBF30618.1 hypothetical protein K9N68_36205 [Kovacikia minuta CCNUW1]
MSYHAIATLLITGLWLLDWLSPMTAISLSVVLLKFALILWQKDWYCTAKIQWVVMLEASSAFIFLAIVALSVLPAHLPA